MKLPADCVQWFILSDFCSLINFLLAGFLSWGSNTALVWLFLIRTKVVLNRTLLWSLSKRLRINWLNSKSVLWAKLLRGDHHKCNCAGRWSYECSRALIDRKETKPSFVMKDLKTSCLSLLLVDYQIEPEILSVTNNLKGSLWEDFRLFVILFSKKTSIRLTFPRLMITKKIVEKMDIFAAFAL